MKNLNEQIIKGEFEFDLQEFVTKRQKELELKIHTQGLSSQYLKDDYNFNNILEQTVDDRLADDIRSAAITRECTATHIYYKYAFLDGFKLALMLMNS